VIKIEVISSAHSTLTNKSRLRLLHLREQNLQDLFQASREQLATLAASSQYVQFLQGIIVQGFLQLLEPEVIIHVREVDAAVAKEAADAASKQYTEISGRGLKHEVVTSLSPDLYVGSVTYSAFALKFCLQCWWREASEREQANHAGQFT
jgi:V-type H+-transporting ATPase subunit E